jgi:hypothetical protein
MRWTVTRSTVAELRSVARPPARGRPDGQGGRARRRSSLGGQPRRTLRRRPVGRRPVRASNRGRRATGGGSRAPRAVGRARAAPENSAAAVACRWRTAPRRQTPCSARNNSSASAVGASAHASDPPVKMTMPTRNSRRRPSWSPRVAAGSSSSTASTRA